MSCPKFSIIIPVYNTEKYIQRCLQSVLNQQFNDYEMIIVNDGSTDGSVQIINRTIQDYPSKRIKLINKENEGLSAARNDGLCQAEGEYVVWLDSDDILSENSLSDLSLLTNQKPDLIISRVAYFFEDNGLIKEQKFYFSYIRMCRPEKAIRIINHKKGFIFAAWCFVSNRQFLIKNSIDFLRGIYHEDELWSPSAILKANTVIFNDNISYVYTINRSNSICSSKNTKKEYDKLIVVNKLRDKKKDCKSLYKSLFVEKRIFLLFFSVYRKSVEYDEENRLKIREALRCSMKNYYNILWCFILIIFKLR